MQSIKIKTNRDELTTLADYLNEIFYHWKKYTEPLNMPRVQCELMKEAFKSFLNDVYTALWRARHKDNPKINLNILYSQRISLNIIFSNYPLPTSLISIEYQIQKGLL